MNDGDTKTGGDVEDEVVASEGKKERVIHTRVPAVLEQELKRLAENVRVPVSNLVRTILEDAVEMADRAGREVESELHKAVSQVSKKRAEILGKKGAPRAPKNPLEGVIGFQPLVLAARARCARCDVKIEEGDEAYVGISTDASAPRVIICEECRPRPRGKKE